MGSGLATAPLVKHHNTIAFGIKKLPGLRGGAAAGAAVNKYTGLAIGVTRLLPVDFVAFIDSQPAVAVGLDGGYREFIAVYLPTLVAGSVPKAEPL